ncbi:MAG: LuxR C-terminal-related transcriptional regulator [Rhodospirillaceae bacterium]|nr:LuxR C-terminal-related transcriptional regulator [Rhodospirillaceae bacterium]
MASARHQPRRNGVKLSSSVLATKLTPPRIRPSDTVPRVQLFEKLSQSLDVALTLVMAPAGYGKTTTLCDWWLNIKVDRSFSCWLTVDESDNDPIQFVNHLVSSINYNIPELNNQIQSAIEFRADMNAHSVCVEIINVLERLALDVVVLIDDLHAITSQQVLDMIGFMANAGSKRLHLVLGSRTHPHFRIAKLRALGEVMVIGASELRFSISEAHDFFVRNGLLSLDADFVDTIVRSVEGWPAGLKLMALSLVNQAAGQVKHKVFGPETGVEEFLRDEVLDHLPKPVLSFVQEAAILGEISAELCDHVMSRSDSSTLLADLEARQLFLSRVGQPGWFRFHQLFADAVVAIGGHKLSERRADLHQRAAAWFEDRDLLVHALRHAFASGNPVFSVEVLERVASTLIQSGRGATLSRYLEMLPVELLKDHPHLLLEYVYSLTLTWRFSDARRFLNEVRANCVNPKRIQQWRKSGFNVNKIQRKLTYCDMQIAILSDDMPRAEGLARQWPTMEGGYSPFEDAVSQTSLIYAEREQFNCRNLAAAGRAREILTSHDNRWGTIWHDCIVGSGYSQIGNLDKAQAIFAAAFDTAVDVVGRSNPTTALPALHLAELLYERNDIETSKALVDEFLPLATQTGLVDQLVAGYQTRVRIAALSSTAEALQALDEGQEIAISRQFERLNAFLVADRVRILSGTGDYGEVRRIGLLYNLSTDPDNHPLGRGVTTASAARAFAAGQIALIQNDLGAAEKLLRRWLRFLEDNQNVRFGIRFAVLLSHVQILLGDQKAAHRSLRLALQMGLKGQFLRSFADANPAVRAQMEQMEILPIGVDAGLAVYHQAVLRVMGSDIRERVIHKVDLSEIGGQYASLNNRESEVLLMISSGMTNNQIASETGLTLGTVKWYLQQIYAKLGVNRRSEAVFKARQLGLMV